MKIEEFIKNKNVLFIGDSITHNWNKLTHDLQLVHPEDPDNDFGFSGYVSKINTAVNLKSCKNIAVSGGCYANCSKIGNRQVWRHFPYQVFNNQDLVKNADVIFVFFGANDYSEQVLFGDYRIIPDDVETATTFYGGMNYGFSLIKKLNPKATIIVLDITPRTIDIDAKTFNYSIDEYNLAISHEVSEYDLKLIKLSSHFCPKCWKEKYSDDGLHPNSIGHDKIAEIILNSDL